MSKKNENTLDALNELRAAARLARLQLDPAEERALAHTFGGLLDAFRSLQEVDVSEESPLAVLGGDRPSALRADEPRSGLDRDELLSRAPEAHDGMFRVPRTVGGEAE